MEFVMRPYRPPTWLRRALDHPKVPNVVRKLEPAGPRTRSDRPFPAQDVPSREAVLSWAAVLSRAVAPSLAAVPLRAQSPRAWAVPSGAQSAEVPCNFCPTWRARWAPGILAGS